MMKKYKTAIILFAVFEAIAISLWLATGSLFYLLNFSYIGLCIGVGLALSRTIAPSANISAPSRSSSSP